LGFQNVAVDHIDNRAAALTGFYYKEMNGQFAGTKSDRSGMGLQCTFSITSIHTTLI